MESVQVTKPNSKPKTVYKGPLVGTDITAPQSLPSVTLYSYTEGKKMYNQYLLDSYETEKKLGTKKQKIPTIVKIVTGLVAIAAIVIAHKDIKNYLWKIFKIKK
jgi:hypothetical protein